MSTTLTDALLILGALAILQGIFALTNGLRFRRYVDAELARPIRHSNPRAAILLPCKGRDERLEDTLRAVTRQNYTGYEVVCAVESEDDPALELIRRFTSLSGQAPMRYVVAEPSTACSQKIVNLLAAIDMLQPDVEVLAFLDSDAVPHEDWLASLVAPLADPGVGATTGYRWYVPRGPWVSLLRCVWNASTLTFLGDHGRNFCWGGSTAVRRTDFERLGVADRWTRVLSEDYELTRSVRTAGMRIRFAPRCVIPSDEPCGWGEFWRFARRQMVITRVCAPKVWAAGAAMAAVFNGAFWGLLVARLSGPMMHPITADIQLGLVYLLAMANGVVRQRAVARLVPDPALRRGAGIADALGAPIVGLLNLALVVASAWGRRFWWRGILYEMQANDRVRILGRVVSMTGPKGRAMPAQGNALGNSNP